MRQYDPATKNHFGKVGNRCGDSKQTGRFALPFRNDFWQLLHDHTQARSFALVVPRRRPVSSELSAARSDKFSRLLLP
jgi:hypothetical protein